MTAHDALRRWVRASSLGWLLGIPFIVLLALAGEAVGIGGAQALVGAGMGLGVGLLQSRALQPLLGRRAPWLVATTVGLTLPFLAADIARMAEWPFRYSLAGCVVAGGVLAGLAQAALLRPRVPRAGAWILASVLGWSLAGGTAYVSDVLFKHRPIGGIPGALLFLAIVAAGGLVLGYITGACLVWLLRGSRPGLAQGSMPSA
jgi:hypothetical protein